MERDCAACRVVLAASNLELWHLESGESLTLSEASDRRRKSTSSRVSIVWVQEARLRAVLADKEAEQAPAGQQTPKSCTLPPDRRLMVFQSSFVGNDSPG